MNFDARQVFNISGNNKVVQGSVKTDNVNIHGDDYKEKYIKVLETENVRLKEENERLKEDLKKMQQRNEAVSLDAEKIRHQADVFKLSGRGLEESDKKMLEKGLNKYVREIDKCIALLQE